MRVLRLVSLELKNFKGIPHFKLDTKGGETFVYGANATGKTTLEDAYQWLLFDKDAEGRSNFEVKTLDKNGEAIHRLEHSVEGTFTLDGKSLVLRKLFKEKYTKKRGQSQDEFTGHTTDYFVDGVPVKKGEYAATINQIASEDTFKLLTSPGYFNSLHWQKRREILMDACGDVSDEEVIANTPKLKDLPKILNGKKPENYKKVLVAKRREVNSELSDIPVRISEAQHSLPNLQTVDIDTLGDEILQVKSEIKSLNEQAARVSGGGETAEKTKQLRELEAELIWLRNDQRGRLDDEVQAVRSLKREYSDKYEELQRTINRHRKNIQENTASIEIWERDMDSLRAAWAEVNNEAFSYEQEDTCPTCGQSLPEEQIAEAREKAEAAFNTAKSERLMQINREGKSIKARKVGLEEENEDEQEAIKEAEALAKKKQKELTAVEKKLQQLTDVAPVPSTEMAKTERAISKLAAEIETLEAGSEKAAARIKNKLEELETELENLEETRAQVSQLKEGQARIAELKAQEKKLAAEFEKLEGELFLLEEFTRSKIGLVEDNINSGFRYAQFKLFNVLVNGAVEECCETTYLGVPFNTNLNRGARMNVGLDIINTLARHYGFAAPIFIDNREAVTKVIETKGQQINLLVSDKDKQMRVETELD